MRRLISEPWSLRARVSLLFTAAIIIGIALGPIVVPIIVTLVRSIARIVAPSTFCSQLGAQVVGDTFDDFGSSLYTYQADCVPPYGRGGSWLWLIGVLVALVIVFVVGRFVARLVLRPVRGMTATVLDMGPQNLGQRLRTGEKKDEFGVLAKEVNNMLGRVAVGLEGQRRFAANASHELRTPLAVQRTLVEVAMITGGPNPDLGRLGAELLLVNERNEQLIEGLLVLAESDRGLSGTVPVALHELADAVIDSYVDLAAKHQVELRRSLRPRTVAGDPVLLERLIGNLVHNAIKYNREGGWVEITVADDPALRVHNTGEHVSTTMLAALFEPFRRGRGERLNSRDGAGLGLSIVRSITMAHHGTVRAVAGADGGLMISVDLPSSSDDVDAAVTPDQ
ncbi:MAG TPA: ATP-binding protein [Pseudonocardiaceae bacterium]|nr:ATP-binding protein [Pseudonocardiaceae bacterium]